jgi:hypothetical protein
MKLQRQGLRTRNAGPVSGARLTLGDERWPTGHLASGEDALGHRH